MWRAGKIMSKCFLQTIKLSWYDSQSVQPKIYCQITCSYEFIGHLWFPLIKLPAIMAFQFSWKQKRSPSVAYISRSSWKGSRHIDLIKIYFYSQLANPPRAVPGKCTRLQ